MKKYRQTQTLNFENFLKIGIFFRIDFAEEVTLFTFPISDVILTLPKLQFQMRKTFYAFIKMQ